MRGGIYLYKVLDIYNYKLIYIYTLEIKVALYDKKQQSVIEFQMESLMEFTKNG